MSDGFQAVGDAIYQLPGLDPALNGPIEEQAITGTDDETLA